MNVHPTEIAITQRLKETKKGYVSGEELARESSISRAAVWKHIKSLREKGYKIEAVPRLGYRLVSSPDSLRPEEIIPVLKTRIIGGKIIYKELIDSTNTFAKELAEKGEREGTVIIAEEQTRGKGRLDRVWSSPPGGIWLSLILRPPVAPSEAARFPLLAAVAAARAIEKLGVQPEIKWPNDVLIDGKKVSGILLELSADLSRVDYLIVGFGINANIDMDKIPEESRDRSTTLAKALGKAVERSRLVADLLFEFERLYKHLFNGGWDDILAEWIERCGMLHKTIALSTLQGVVEGEFVGVDDFGAIRIKVTGGDVKTFAAGDVTIKKDH